MYRAVSVCACMFVLQLAACATISVHDEPAPGANLASLSSFAWDGGRVVRQKMIEGAAVDLAAIADRALLDGLTAHGYRQDQESADFHVSYLVVVEAKTYEARLQEFRESGLGRRQGGETSYEVQYEEGTLSIEFREAETGELLWRGWAEAEVELGISAEQRGLRAREAIRLLLDRLPPRRS